MPILCRDTRNPHRSAPISRRPTSYPLLNNLMHNQERRKRGLDVLTRCVAPSGYYQVTASENFSPKEAELHLDFPSGWTNNGDALSTEEFAIPFICRFLENTRIIYCLLNVRTTLKIRSS